MYSFFQNCFGFVITYGVSYALAALKWKGRMAYVLCRRFVSRITADVITISTSCSSALTFFCVYLTW